MRPALGVMIFASAVVSGCADRLPDQDRRILVAAPVAKVSTDLLWSDFQKDGAAAHDRYWGEVIEVTGKVSSVAQSPARIMFLPGDSSAGIEARPLEDQAAATLAAATVGERLTLRCYCEGLQTNVILKSCINP